LFDTGNGSHPKSSPTFADCPRDLVVLRRRTACVLGDPASCRAVGEIIARNTEVVEMGSRSVLCGRVFVLQSAGAKVF
jgi:hypothetical protein